MYNNDEFNFDGPIFNNSQNVSNESTTTENQTNITFNNLSELDEPPKLDEIKNLSDSPVNDIPSLDPLESIKSNNNDNNNDLLSSYDNGVIDNQNELKSNDIQYEMPINSFLVEAMKKNNLNNDLNLNSSSSSFNGENDFLKDVYQTSDINLQSENTFNNIENKVNDEFNNNFEDKKSDYDIENKVSIEETGQNEYVIDQVTNVEEPKITENSDYNNDAKSDISFDTKEENEYTLDQLTSLEETVKYENNDNDRKIKNEELADTKEEKAYTLDQTTSIEENKKNDTNENNIKEKSDILDDDNEYTIINKSINNNEDYEEDLDELGIMEIYSEPDILDIMNPEDEFDNTLENDDIENPEIEEKHDEKIDYKDFVEELKELINVYINKGMNIKIEEFDFEEMLQIIVKLTK